MIDSADESEIAGFRPAQVAGWAIFLGTSWTWCIGMFLPVIVLRDWGWGTSIPFVIFNIFGAAAMGWVLSRDGSRSLVRDHRAACTAFSIATIFFHIYFASWFIRPFFGMWMRPAIIVAIAIFCSLLLWKKGGMFFAATAALAVSLAMAGWGFSAGVLPRVALPMTEPSQHPIDALWMSLACMFGFLLCPYLDLTFHAARQNLNNAESRSAFSIGFIAIFGSMLALTFCVTGWYVQWLGHPFDWRDQPILRWVIGVHLLVQSALTIALHLDALKKNTVRMARGVWLGIAVLAIPVILAGELDLGRYRGLLVGEQIYRAFLVFFALLFPGYVWLRVIRPILPLRVWVISSLAAMPLLWMGFNERRAIFVVPGILIPMLARLLPARASSDLAAAPQESHAT